MTRKLSTAEKVRRLIDQGYTNKTIIEKLGIKPQAVYNIRYQTNKERGLGAIGKIAPPTNGIGAPPKRKRKVRAGTGINATPMPLPVAVPEPMPVVMFEPPTLWERAKTRFFNVMRALGA